MTKALFFVLAALLVVAVVADFEFDDDEAADVEFMKRDTEMQDLLLATKRGSKINKYFACPRGKTECWCNRRNMKTVFCHGGADV